MQGCGKTAEEKKREISVATEKLAREKKREEMCGVFEDALLSLQNSKQSDSVIRFVHGDVEVSLKKIQQQVIEKDDKGRVLQKKTPTQVFEESLKEIELKKGVGTIKFSTEDGIDVSLERKKEPADPPKIFVSEASLPVGISLVSKIEEKKPEADERRLIFPRASSPESEVTITVSKDGVVKSEKKIVKPGHAGPGYAYIFNDSQIVTVERVDRVEQDGDFFILYIVGQATPAVTNGQVFVSPVQPKSCPDCPPERKVP